MGVLIHRIPQISIAIPGTRSGDGHPWIQMSGINIYERQRSWELEAASFFGASTPVNGCVIFSYWQEKTEFREATDHGHVKHCETMLLSASTVSPCTLY